jgi:hypothetical protein
LKWKFVETETEGTYYIQQFTTGSYITTVQSGRVKAESCDTADAVAFTVKLVAPGEFYIQRADAEKVKIYHNSTTISAGNKTDAEARWFIRMDDEKTEDDMLTFEVSTDNKLILYYMIRTDYGEYAYYNSSRSYKGRIASDLYKEPENSSYCFYFKQGSQEGKYTIHNYKTEKAVTKKADNVLYVDKDDAGVEFTITPNEQATGLTIAEESGNWNAQASTTGLVELNAEKSTGWKLQHVRTIAIDEDPSAIHTENRDETTPSASCLDGSIAISGVSAGEEIYVYSSIGGLVATTEATDGTTMIHTGLPKGSIVFVVTSKHRTKLQIR